MERKIEKRLEKAQKLLNNQAYTSFLLFEPELDRKFVRLINSVLKKIPILADFAPLPNKHNQNDFKNKNDKSKEEYLINRYRCVCDLAVKLLETIHLANKNVTERREGNGQLSNLTKMTERLSRIESALADFWPLECFGEINCQNITVKLRLKAFDSNWLLLNYKELGKCNKSKEFGEKDIFFWTLQSTFLKKMKINNDGYDLDGNLLPEEAFSVCRKESELKNERKISMLRKQYQFIIQEKFEENNALKDELNDAKEQISKISIEFQNIKDEFKKYKEKNREKQREKTSRENSKPFNNSKNHNDPNLNSDLDLNPNAEKRGKINLFINLSGLKLSDFKKLSKENIELIQQNNLLKKKIIDLKDKTNKEKIAPKNENSFKKNDETYLIRNIKNIENNFGTHISLEKEETNSIEYLKHILMRFLMDKPLRKDLIPVLCKLLNYDESERKEILDKTNLNF